MLTCDSIMMQLCNSEKIVRNALKRNKCPARLVAMERDPASAESKELGSEQQELQP